MKRRFLMWLGVAVIANGVAHAQTVTTLDPSAFASGTNVTGAFAGVTLLTFALRRCWCSSERRAVVCTELRLGVRRFRWPRSTTHGHIRVQHQPLTGEFATFLWAIEPGSLDPASRRVALTTYPFCSGWTPLLIEFAAPVTSVSIFEDENNYNGVYMEAFNASNQIAGDCGTIRRAPLPVGNYGCYSALTNPPDLVNQEMETSVSSSGGISKILIGGYNNGVAVSTIKYTTVSAPEIDPTSAASGLTLLLGTLVVLRGRRTKRLRTASA